MDCRYEDGKCSRCGRAIRSRRVRRNCKNPPPRGVPAQVAQASVAGGIGEVLFGPGAELRKLLSRIGITAAPNCSCQRHANEMDARGCDWCEDNLDTIVGWLREEATKRGLPFLDAAGRILVRRAISNARRAAAN
jgi:hypothetical protein